MTAPESPDSSDDRPATPPGLAPADPPGVAPADPPGVAPADPPGLAPADPPGLAPADPPGVEETEPDPRFSYANERTFLAWIRTALGLVTAGLVVTQLFPKFDVPFGRRLIGLPLIALGVLIAVSSYSTWRANERAMRRGEPLPRSVLPRLVAVVVSVVAVIGFVLVLWDGIDG